MSVLLRTLFREQFLFGGVFAEAAEIRRSRSRKAALDCLDLIFGQQAKWRKMTNSAALKITILFRENVVWGNSFVCVQILNVFVAIENVHVFEQVLILNLGHSKWPR